MKTDATSIDPFVHGAASPPKPSGAPSFIVSKMILGPSKTGSQKKILCNNKKPYR